MNMRMQGVRIRGPLLRWWPGAPGFEKATKTTFSPVITLPHSQPLSDIGR